MQAPWFALRLQHASAAEIIWRALPAPPARTCPPGPNPEWPWPISLRSQAPSIEPALFTPAFGSWSAMPAVDPKPLWAAHRLHDWMRIHAAGGHVPIDRWWRTHTPPNRLWTSPHAVASRVPALALLGHREALWAHADHLRRHPSRFSSANNHRVAELAALALAHRCMPDLPAPSPLRPILAAQLHPDGWGREQSVAYLAHCLEWGLIAHRCGEDLSDLLHAGATALEHTIASDGTSFAIGDEGGDWVLPGPATAHDVVGCVRSALNQPAVRWTPGIRAQLLGLGPALPAREPGSRSFPDGGLSIVRSHRLQVAIDHGPLGLPPLHAHGHDDLLAVWAHRDGAPWLVGRGTSVYHDPAVRRAQRGSLGTCGLVLGGRHRAQPHSHPFLWQHVPTAPVLQRVCFSADGGTVTAHHDAYAPVRHTRTVEVDGADLIITDCLAGTGVHHVALRWHLAPGLTGTPLGDGVHRIHSPLPVHIDTVPHAVAYGHTVPAHTLVAEAPVRLPAVLVTRFSTT